MTRRVAAPARLAAAFLAGMALAQPAPAQQVGAKPAGPVPGPAGLGVIGEAPVSGTDGLPQDVDEGLSLIEEAAAAGDPRALRVLGGALLWGWPVPADPARGRALLAQAAEAGDVPAMRILGEALVGGWSVPRDVARGRALLDRAIAAGDAQARVALGKLMLYGTGLPADPAAARALFEAAAAQGEGEGLEAYGGWLMWSRRDPAGAEAMLRRAGELGRGSAWTLLAEGAMYGYLGRGSRAKFADYAELARGAGEQRIAVLEAERQMWGIGMRANGPAAVALLEQAVAESNGTALKALVALLRDGNGLNVRRDRARARALLDRHAQLLRPDEAERLALTLDIAAARTSAEFDALERTLAAGAAPLSAAFAREIHAANPNFAIYLLQSRLKREGLYAGPLNGFATRSTIRAMIAACRTLDDTSGCADSVMNPKVIAALMAR